MSKSGELKLVGEALETLNKEYANLLKKRFALNSDAAYNYLRDVEFRCLKDGRSTYEDFEFQKALELVGEARSLQKFQIRDLFMEGREKWNDALK